MESMLGHDSCACKQEQNRDKSQEWKSRLEEAQRADRKLRQQGRKSCGLPSREHTVA